MLEATKADASAAKEELERWRGLAASVAREQAAALGLRGQDGSSVALEADVDPISSCMGSAALRRAREAINKVGRERRRDSGAYTRIHVR